MMQFFSELQRRRVIRGAGLYAVGAWVTTEVSATVLPLLYVPEKFVTGIVITLILLFPVAMVLVWIYDLSPAGISRTPDMKDDGGGQPRPGMLFHVLLLVLAMMVFGYGLFWVGSTRALQSVPRSSVAVLPFKNLSSDSGKDYFSDGISEEILNLLAQVEGLSVAARTSSFALRDSSDDIRKIGRKLGVEAVLEGSVRWAEETDKVRVTAQLIDAESGYHLWSENFDRELKDIISLQSEIAGAIVDVLRIKLGTDQRTWQAPTKDQVAYDAYLQGRKLLNQRRVSSLRQSIDFFHRALSRDPAFAQAHAAIAVAYLSLPSFSDEPVDKLREMAKESAQQALALSPELAEAHAVRARLAQYAGRWSDAQFAFFAATSVDTHDVTTRVWYAEFLLASGKLAEARTQASIALALESDNPLAQAITAEEAMTSNNNETCVKHATKARDLGFARSVYIIEGICLARLGRMQEASRALAAAIDQRQDASGLREFAKLLMVSKNLAAAARTAWQTMAFQSPDPRALLVAIVAGDNDAAFARLQQEFADGDHSSMSLLWSPEAAGLRQDARFRKLMKQSGVVEIWRNDPPDLCAAVDGNLRCH
ncbi:MAG: hypothetical protein ACR2P1_03415 [Pseudomonadales bacterium]